VGRNAHATRFVFRIPKLQSAYIGYVESKYQAGALYSDKKEEMPQKTI